MTTFFEANQVRLILKMKLSQYSWYNDCCVVTSEDNSDFSVLVGVAYINDKVRRVVPKRLNGATIKLKVD